MVILSRDCLSGISMAEFWLGVVGEGFNMTVWGGLGRQGSRVIHLGMATVSLVINIPCLLWVLHYLEGFTSVVV